MSNPLRPGEIVELLKQQLDLSILFANTAIESSDVAEAARNTADALSGYNAVLRFRNRGSLNSRDWKLVLEKLSELESALVRAGAMCRISQEVRPAQRPSQTNSLVIPISKNKNRFWLN
jgi:hypothetical protein